MSFAVILGLIKELLAMPAQLRALVDDFNAFRAEWKAFQAEKWIQKLNQDFAPIEKGPSTTQEKQDAAKNIANDIASL